MEITVDTKKDSSEDIKKAIRLLQQLIEDESDSDAPKKPITLTSLTKEKKQREKKQDTEQPEEQGEAKIVPY